MTLWQGALLIWAAMAALRFVMKLRTRRQEERLAELRRLMAWRRRILHRMRKRDWKPISRN